MKLQLRLLPLPDELLDIAFRKARKKAEEMKRQRNRLKERKSKSIKKIEVSANYFSEALQKAANSFPKLHSLHPFYRELIGATVDLDTMLRAIAQMKAASRIAVKLKRQHIGKVKGLQRGEGGKAAGIVKEFYGRLGSLAKSLAKGTEAYNKNTRKMRELPSVRFDLPTVIIAGYPNTGKTTLLARLTKSRPKVAAYPFTTQKLQIGYLIHNEKEWEMAQLIDTPGLLDRPLGKRNRIERKAVAALRHLANAIVFVADPTMRCGFELEKQARLLKEIRAEFRGAKVLVVLNKADAASREEMEKARKAFGKGALAEGQGIGGKVREELQRLL